MFWNYAQTVVQVMDGNLSINRRISLNSAGSVILQQEKTGR